MVGEPTILTYHSYANRVANEHALRLGVEPPEQMLGEAAAWQQVERIVRNYDGEMSGVTDSVSTVIRNVSRLVSQLQENEVEPWQLRQVAEEFTKSVSNKSAYQGRDRMAPTRDAEQVQYERTKLIPLLEEVMRFRRERAQFTFDDQMALAAHLAGAFPDVGEIERSKFHVVLLDEYQDTSSSQLRLMKALFGNGHSVTAVGDPHQAIYAWRGASSDTIGAFPTDFRDRVGAPAQLFTLSTSWRNDQSILDLANAIAEPLRAQALDTPILKAKPTAVQGLISGGIYGSIRDEAEAIAEAIAPHWSPSIRVQLPMMRERAKSDSAFRFIESTAILVRKRKQIPEIEMALRARGIPVEVVGIDGLIHVPEVAEIRAALTVITNSDEGSALIKLMSSGYWQIGIRDMSTLAQIARERELAQSGGKRVSVIERLMLGGNSEEDELSKASIIETLDELNEPHSESGFTANERARFSPIGLDRLERLAKVLRRLRALAHLPLPDLIYHTERELHLGVDVEMTTHSRRYLDKFMDEAANFYAQGGTLRSFLSWLNVAEDEERGLRAGGIEVRKDVVQILTVHSAKGGEWDLVVVPGLADGNFPSEQSADNWLKSAGVLPFSLRADRKRLPKFDVSNQSTVQEVGKSIDAFAELCNARKDDEERRLAYVAFTRAKHQLLLTTSWWRDGQRAKDPSAYLLTALEHIQRVGAHFDGSLDEKPSDGEENPKSAYLRKEEWPHDPLGKHREAFARVSDEVHALSSPGAAAQLNQELDLIASGKSELQRELLLGAELIIREISERGSAEKIYLPAHLSVSALMAYAQSPQEYAARLRRPLPFKPDPIARRGTAFHSWLEERFALATPLIGDDELPGAADEGALDDSALERLKEKWLRSPWAQRTPYKVEVPFERSIDGTIVRGRMDAVYKSDDGTFDVVDWKTGSAKRGAELTHAAIQLAVYRLAWSEIEGVPLDRVRAAFHYVGSEETVRPSDLLDYEGLLTLIHAVPVESATPTGK
jgi:DNA helicase-2/ATP-dependent DNA helicase PcrA